MSSIREKITVKEKTKVFVGGLNSITSEISLSQYFSKYGRVIESVIMRYSNGISRCFGFVTFDDPSVIDSIVRTVHILDNKQVLVS